MSDAHPVPTLTGRGRGQTAYGILVMLAALVGAMLACGGSEGAIGLDVQLSPENVRIEGLPQFICPTSTPRPTHTQMPTQIQPTVYIPPGGYATYTPVPGCVWNGTVCATAVPLPGGIYTTPGHIAPGATSTPCPTFTPWPTPTPYTSTYFYSLGDDVYTDHASSALELRLQVGDVQEMPSSRYTDRQIVVYEVQIENRGSTFYVIFAPVQIFVAGIGGQDGGWWASGEAANEAGITLQEAAVDGVQIDQGETGVFQMAAYTPIGAVDSIAWVLDPFANGFDGQIAGGNVAYWTGGSHPGCVGNVDGPFTPPPNLTPNPTATLTPTIAACTGMVCVTRMP